MVECVLIEHTSGAVTMAEPLDTLGDVADCLRYQTEYYRYLEGCDRRSQEFNRMRGASTSDLHRMVSINAFSAPSPSRLSLDQISAFPVYIRMVKVALREYRSELSPDLIRTIFADNMRGTGVTFPDAWQLPVDELERRWEEKEKPPPPVRTETPMTLGQFFARLEFIESNDRTNPMPSMTPSNDDVCAGIQYGILREGIKNELRATPGYEAFRTCIAIAFKSKLASEILPKVVEMLIAAKAVTTFAEAEALTLEEVVALLNGKARPKQTKHKSKEQERLYASILTLHKTVGAESEIVAYLGRPEGASLREEVEKELQHRPTVRSKKNPRKRTARDVVRAALKPLYPSANLKGTR